ncbi:radical SAM enzyme [Trametes versicolor FP-101664 SS1]|uniref:radical SAM enzyme n=1 Tax=Trametes versicolor (strain FP-101664) TaxID=717944 RepID=UPI0004623E5E|nr:radical SAM enzyme [Trametes versicolor FP-101664 SS1]EIW63993.1 radical SAM enzyme [Trametes versicolor FP-101664 SS1]
MIRQAAVSSQAPLKPISRNLSTSAVLRHAEVLPELASSASGLRNRIKHRISRVDAERGPSVSPFLVDSFARRHNYLRISLTERCNLRCFYCMPSEGIELSPPEHILSDDEVIRLATLFVKSGVTKIRLTGGEPMVRKGIVDIVGRLHGLRKHGLQSIGMTTNGIALHRKLPALVANGLTHLNISLDTLDPFKFEIMTRRMGHDAVLRSLQTALASRELQSVKLNVVVVKGLNDHEVPDFVEMTRESRPVLVVNGSYKAENDSNYGLVRLGETRPATRPRARYELNHPWPACPWSPSAQTPRNTARHMIVS